MKKLVLLLALSTASLIGYTQNKTSSSLIAIDTINISGKVINEKGEAIPNATILTTSLDTNLNYINTKTDNKGEFVLKGIHPVEFLTIFEKNGFAEIRNNGSRSLLITLAPLIKKNLNDINSRDKDFVIEAKRLKTKEKLTFQEKTRTFSFDETNYYYPATYPGGIAKLYAFLKKAIVYPEAAIKNNMEGTVIIEFTVTGTGSTDFNIIRDVGYGCGAAVIEALKKSKRWNAAMVSGKYIPQRVAIEVPFKLEN